MSTGKEQLDVDVEDDFVATDSDEATEAPVEVAKTNLSKRRTIDNLLEERRLQKQLADYDFDL
ncbi:PA3496 family putative envelope integrity protein [Pseudomonas mucidolens]|uniref:PA3496 family putative envelope integrity protein n=1 Tax=Pseudomonas mucidolens TaxID=46679 RepID=UPI0030DB97B8